MQNLKLRLNLTLPAALQNLVVVEYTAGFRKFPELVYYTEMSNYMSLK
jgi:hypothetical protein